MTARTRLPVSFRRANCRRVLGYLLLLLIAYGSTVAAVHSHGPVAPDRPGVAAITDARRITVFRQGPFSAQRMLDVPVPAATFQWPCPCAAVRAHAFDADCVCFHPDSFSSLNFNQAAIGSRAASRLSLTRWRGSSDGPHQISSKPNGQHAQAFACQCLAY